MQPQNETFFSLFGEAGSNAVVSAAIRLEFVAAPHEHWVEFVKACTTPSTPAATPFQHPSRRSGSGVDAALWRNRSGESMGRDRGGPIAPCLLLENSSKTPQCPRQESNLRPAV